MKEKQSRREFLENLALAGAGLLSGVALSGCGKEGPLESQSGRWLEESQLKDHVLSLYRNRDYKAIQNMEVIGDDVVITGDFKRVTSKDQFGRETRVPYNRAVIQIGGVDTPKVDAPRLGINGGIGAGPFNDILTDFYNYITWSDKYFISGINYPDKSREYLLSE